MEEKPIYRLVKSYNGHWGLRWNGRPDYNYMPKQVTRDNQKAYNVKSGDGGYGQISVRVPSLKRSDKVWRNFYNLFPYIKGQKTFRGCKLKQIK
jgi:hypothetical protein